MSDIYVQFADEKNVEIKAVFGCLQDESIYPNQMCISLSDEMYHTYYQSLPKMMQDGIDKPE